MAILRGPKSRQPLQAVQTRIKEGMAGNIQTVDMMKRVALDRRRYPDVREFAMRIVNFADTRSHDYYAEALAVGNYVKAHVRYLKDPVGVEQLCDPLTIIDMIRQGTARGDCDDMSLLTATLLLAIGHEPAFRCVRYFDTKGAYNHIYVVDYVEDRNGDEKRLVIDCILKNREIGYEVTHISGDEYFVTG